MSAALRSVSPLPSSIARAVVKKKKAFSQLKKTTTTNTQPVSVRYLCKVGPQQGPRADLFVARVSVIRIICLFCYVESTQAFVLLTASVAFVVSVCGRAAS